MNYLSLDKCKINIKYQICDIKLNNLGIDFYKMFGIEVGCIIEAHARSLFGKTIKLVIYLQLGQNSIMIRSCDAKNILIKAV